MTYAVYFPAIPTALDLAAPDAAVFLAFDVRQSKMGFNIASQPQQVGILGQHQGHLRY